LIFSSFLSISFLNLNLPFFLAVFTAFFSFLFSFSFPFYFPFCFGAEGIGIGLLSLDPEISDSFTNNVGL
jgi:hypothetical protein